MVNLTNCRTYLREGTILRNIEVLYPSIVAVDEEGSPNSLSEDFVEDAARSIITEGNFVSDTASKVCPVPR